MNFNATPLYIPYNMHGIIKWSVEEEHTHARTHTQANTMFSNRQPKVFGIFWNTYARALLSL